MEGENPVFLRVCVNHKIIVLFHIARVGSLAYVLKQIWKIGDSRKEKHHAKVQKQVLAGQ